jgi:hypothetical protein
MDDGAGVGGYGQDTGARRGWRAGRSGGSAGRWARWARSGSRRPLACRRSSGTAPQRRRHGDAGAARGVWAAARARWARSGPDLGLGGRGHASGVARLPGCPGLCCRWRPVSAGLLPTRLYCRLVRVIGGRSPCSSTAGSLPRSAVTISVSPWRARYPAVVVDMLLLVCKLPSAVVAGYLLLSVSVSPGCGLLPG